MTTLRIRAIEPADDAAMAAVIRVVMPEFGADGPGFAIHDPEVDFMSRAYSIPGAAYFVIVDETNRVLGGAGVAALIGGPEGVCELRKMYFMPEARGRGIAEPLLRRCLSTAKSLGFRQCYLETLTGMKAAQRLYLRVGFEPTTVMGSTGHGGCNRFYLLDLAHHPD